jgi:hypothetical protein
MQITTIGLDIAKNVTRVVLTLVAKQQPDKPNWSEAARRLVKFGLAASNG